MGLTNDNDTCCHSNNCTFKPNAKCSKHNFPCCNNHCQFADKTTPCGEYRSCSETSYCTGVDKECPTAKFITDGSQCGYQGKCMNGVCLTFCQTLGLQSCLCTTPGDRCKRCCRNGTFAMELEDNSICVPYRDGNGNITQLKDNSKCLLGYCKNGQCMKATQDVIGHIRDIFNHPSMLAKRMADNIVGIVIILSLLIWIPCSCFMDFIDRKRLELRRKAFDKRETTPVSSFHFQSIPNTPRFLPTSPLASKVLHYRRTSSTSTLNRTPWNFRNGARVASYSKNRSFFPQDWSPPFLEKLNENDEIIPLHHLQDEPLNYRRKSASS